jgi:hypothetical protein
MAIPAQAFGEIYPKELRPGSIFKFRSNWAMLVTNEDGSTLDFLMLGGEHAGQLFNVTPGMPKCLGVIPPFTWFPALEEGAGASHTEHQTTTLTLTPSGPVIIGANTDGYDPKYFAFRLDGVVDRDYQPYGIGLRFSDWTVELQHPERPFESLGSLFSVRAV